MKVSCVLHRLAFRANKIRIWIAASRLDPHPAMQKHVIGIIRTDDERRVFVLATICVMD
jgi:hypothetical protein